MGFRAAFDLLRGQASKTLGSVSPELEDRHRVDLDNPLKVGIGSTLMLSTETGSALARAKAFRTTIAPPTGEQNWVVGIARIKGQALTSAGLKVYRYYLALADNESDKPECFVQVVVKEGQIIERVYFSRMNRMYPDNVEQIAWLKGLSTKKSKDLKVEYEDGSGIAFAPGNQRFTLSFNDGVQLIYEREVQGPAYISPTSLTETRIEDRFGEEGMQQDILQLTYSRTTDVGNMVEYLYIDLENQSSDDGKRADGVRVDFYVGCKVSETDLTTAV
jgi:hypothetical protein